MDPGVSRARKDMCAAADLLGSQLTPARPNRIESSSSRLFPRRYARRRSAWTWQARTSSESALPSFGSKWWRRRRF